MSLPALPRTSFSISSIDLSREYRGMVEQSSFRATFRAVTLPHPDSRVRLKAAATIISLLNTVLCATVTFQ
jgi:hypothetical protein